MSLFYTKNGAPYVPDEINPQLVHLAKIIVKNNRLTLKFQMRTNGLFSALNNGDEEQMKNIMFKCIEKNEKLYDRDMALSHAEMGDVDEAFFADKDKAFFENQIKILIDFAYINCVITANLMPVMSSACKRSYGKELEDMLFFSNQAEGTDENTASAEAPAEE